MPLASLALAAFCCCSQNTRAKDPGAWSFVTWEWWCSMIFIKSQCMVSSSSRPHDSVESLSFIWMVASLRDVLALTALSCFALAVSSLLFKLLKLVLLQGFVLEWKFAFEWFLSIDRSDARYFMHEEHRWCLPEIKTWHAEWRIVVSSARSSTFATVTAPTKYVHHVNIHIVQSFKYTHCFAIVPDWFLNNPWWCSTSGRNRVSGLPMQILQFSMAPSRQKTSEGECRNVGILCVDDNGEDSSTLILCVW